MEPARRPAIAETRASRGLGVRSAPGTRTPLETRGGEGAGPVPPDASSGIGYASALTMLEAADHDEHSYLEIAEAIETRSPHASDDLAELWQRIALNVLSNTDDHLRNHAFLHTEANQWRLSPAFDLNPNPKRLGHLRMSIDGDDPDASIDKLLRVSPYFRIRSDDAHAALAPVLAATLRWRELAASHGLSRDAIRELEPAFEHDQQAKARSRIGI